MKRRAHGGTLHGQPMTGHDELGLERGQALHRFPGLVPVLRVVHRRAMQFWALDYHRIGRFLLGRDKGVSGNKDPVRITPEHDLPRRMARSVDPSPPRHERNAPISWKPLKTLL